MALFGPRDLFLSFAKDGSLTEPYCSQAKSPIKRCPHAGPKAKLFFFFSFPFLGGGNLGSDMKTDQNKCLLCWRSYMGMKKAIAPSTAFLSISYVVSEISLRLASRHG